jgi:hypothetical protein
VLNMNTIKIVDVATGTDIEREMTEEEISDSKEQQKIAKKELADAESQAKTKAIARQAILDRLGITADEAAILLG